MMRAACNILAAVAVVGGTFPAYGAAFWQQHKAAPRPAQQQTAPAATPKSNSLVAQPQVGSQNAIPPQHLKGPGPHKGDWLRKYGELPPAEQEQKLESDPVFQSLTPERQKSLLDRLRSFNSLSPSKRQQVLNRMETYEHLSPEQQHEANNLYKSYRGLPSDQQSQVSQAYRKMRLMTPEERSDYLSSDECQNGFNEKQRTLLRGLSELYPNPANK
jgi:Protein of unknown function (DUF3106)